MRNLFLDELSDVTLEDVKNFVRVDEPDESQRPAEGPRVDFKAEKPSEIGLHVAAMANTYGGLILIGVKSERTKHNVPVSVDGVPVGRGDLKAQITHQIYSTVHPRPAFDIAVVPSDSEGRAIVLVRVSEGEFPPYEFLQGATVCIPVRVQDTDRQANVRQIESLLAKRDRLQKSPAEMATEILSAKGPYAKSLSPVPVWAFPPDPGQMVFLIPRGDLRLVLDTGLEKKFESDVRFFFPSQGELGGFRRGKFFLLHRGDALNKKTWEVWSSGAVGFAGSFRSPVSLGSIASDFLDACRLARRFLEGHEYMGYIILAHRMWGGRVEIYTDFPPLDPPDPTVADIPPGRQNDPDKSENSIQIGWAELESPERAVARVLLEALRETRGAKLSLDWFYGAITKLAHERNS